MIGTLPLAFFGPVDIGSQPNAVPHRHHHLPFNDGRRFEFLLRLQSLLSLCRRECPFARYPEAIAIWATC